jgi:hypothetical protein
MTHLLTAMNPKKQIIEYTIRLFDTELDDLFGALVSKRLMLGSNKPSKLEQELKELINTPL